MGKEKKEKKSLLTWKQAHLPVSIMWKYIKNLLHENVIKIAH